MKILLVSASGIFDENYKETQKNNSGFGHMIKELAILLQSEGDSVDIITQSVLTQGRNINGATLLKKTISDLLIHNTIFYMKKAIDVIKNTELSNGMKLRTILYYATGSYCEWLLKVKKYDVCHINGIGNDAMPFLFACSRTNTPIIITLHGLISFDESVKTDSFSKNIEKMLLKECLVNPSITLTVVSSGIKKRICEYLHTDNLDNVHVICNPLIMEQGIPSIDESLIKNGRTGRI